MSSKIWIIALIGVLFFVIVGLMTFLQGCYSLRSVKRKVVGDGQHGSAHWATDSERKRMYKEILFDVPKWRTDESSRPKEEGILIGGSFHRDKAYCYVDTGDVHALMVGAAGVGKTAYWLYPNLEYACASGVSFVATDTKGDLARNYGTISKNYYGYDVAVIDL